MGFIQAIKGAVGGTFMVLCQAYQLLLVYFQEFQWEQTTAEAKTLRVA